MATRTNILLAGINSGKSLCTCAPLSLLYIRAATLKDRFLRKSSKTSLEEFFKDSGSKEIAEKILKEKPDIIGFTTCTWNFTQIVEVSSIVKKLRPKAVIVLGGPEASPLASEILTDHTDIDIVVRGEGEITFVELSKALIKNTRLENIKGITYRKNGQILNTEDRAPVKNLDSIPSPFEDPFIKKFKNREIPIETQRGCVFKCAFCYYGKSFDRTRYFSLKRVKRDLDLLFRIRPKRIYLMDPVFNINRKRAKEIASFIIMKNKKKIPFHTEIRAELVDEELAGLLSKANITQLEVGLQSTNENVLNLTGRIFDREKFERGVRLLNDYNLDIQLQLIAGLPGDTLGTLLESFDFIMGLEPKGFAIFPLEVLPGTKLWNDAEKLNLVFSRKPRHFVAKTGTISPRQMGRIFHFIQSSYLLWRLFVVRLLCKDTGIPISRFILKFTDWLGEKGLCLENLSKEETNDQISIFARGLYEKNPRKLDMRFYDALIKKELEKSTRSSCCFIPNGR